MSNNRITLNNNPFIKNMPNSIIHDDSSSKSKTGNNFVFQQNNANSMNCFLPQENSSKKNFFPKNSINDNTSNSLIFNDIFANQTIDDIFSVTSSKKNPNIALDNRHEQMADNKISFNFLVPLNNTNATVQQNSQPLNLTKPTFDSSNNTNPFLAPKTENRQSFNIANAFANNSFSTESEKNNRRTTLNMKAAMDILYNDDVSNDDSFELEMSQKRETLNNTPSNIKNKRLVEILDSNNIDITDSDINQLSDINNSGNLEALNKGVIKENRITMDINNFWNKPPETILKPCQDKPENTRITLTGYDMMNTFNSNTGGVKSYLPTIEEAEDSKQKLDNNRITIKFGSQQLESYACENKPQELAKDNRITIDPNNFNLGGNVVPMKFNSQQIDTFLKKPEVMNPNPKALIDNQNTRIPLNIIKDDNKPGSARKVIPLSPRVKLTNKGDVDTRLENTLSYIAEESNRKLKQIESLEKEILELAESNQETHKDMEIIVQKQKELEKQIDTSAKNTQRLEEMRLLKNCFLRYMGMSFNCNEYDKLRLMLYERVFVIFNFKTKDEVDLLRVKSDYIINPSIAFELIQNYPTTQLNSKHTQVLSDVYSDMLKHFYNSKTALTVNGFYRHLRTLLKYTASFVYLYDVIKIVEFANKGNKIDYSPTTAPNAVNITAFIPNINGYIVKIIFEISVYNSFYGIVLKGYEIIEIEDCIQETRLMIENYMVSIERILRDPNKIRNRFFFKNLVMKIYETLNNI
jgi:hypothetical protein